MCRLFRTRRRGTLLPSRSTSRLIHSKMVAVVPWAGLSLTAVTQTILSFGLDRRTESRLLVAFGKLLWIQNDLITRHYQPVSPAGSTPCTRTARSAVMPLDPQWPRIGATSRGVLHEAAGSGAAVTKMLCREMVLRPNRFRNDRRALRIAAASSPQTGAAVPGLTSLHAHGVEGVPGGEEERVGQR